MVATLPAGQNYGVGAAAALVNQVKARFEHIWFALLVGVAAGLPNLSASDPTKRHDIRLGDVLVYMPDKASSAPNRPVRLRESYRSCLYTERAAGRNPRSCSSCNREHSAVKEKTNFGKGMSLPDNSPPFRMMPRIPSFNAEVKRRTSCSRAQRRL